MNEKANLWRKVVTVKYGEDGFGWFHSKSISIVGRACGELISQKYGRDSFHTLPLR